MIGLNRSLKAIGGESANLRKITAASTATGTAMERASRNTAELERRILALKATGAGLSNVPSLVPLPGGGSGGGRGRGGGGHGGRHGGNIHMGPGGVGIGTVGMAAGDAFVPLAITGAMVWGGHALFESAKDLNTEMQRFKLFGMSDKVNQEAFKFVAGMRVYGTSQAENMKNFREAQGVFRESGMSEDKALEGAKLAAPFLGKIAFATESLDDESKARMRTSSLAMLRFVEMSGGLNPTDFKRWADFGFRMTQTSGGTVNWEQLRQFKAISGVAGRSLSEDALAGLEPIISELKGGGAGTGLRTAFNRLTGIIKIPNQVAHELVKSGVWDAAKIDFNANGGIKRFKGNPLKTMAELTDNPEQWYYKNILPMYDRMKLSDPERLRQDAMLFGSTGGRLFSQIRLQRNTVENSVLANHKALNLDPSANVAKNSLSGQEQEFVKSWTDFKTQLGIVALPQFSNLLQNGASVLRAIGDFMRDNAGVVAVIKNIAGGAINVFSPVSRIRDIYREAVDLLPKRPGGATGAWGDPVKTASNAQPVQVHAQINMDGQKVASLVTRHQEKVANRPQTGSRWFDSGMAPPPVNFSPS